VARHHRLPHAQRPRQAGGHVAAHAAGLVHGSHALAVCFQLLPLLLQEVQRQPARAAKRGAQHRPLGARELRDVAQPRGVQQLLSSGAARSGQEVLRWVRAVWGCDTAGDGGRL
jgi:hypothetical protein